MSRMCINDNKKKEPEFSPDEEPKKTSHVYAIWDVIQIAFVSAFILCVIFGWLYVIYISIRWLIKVL